MHWRYRLSPTRVAAAAFSFLLFYVAVVRVIFGPGSWSAGSFPWSAGNLKLFSYAATLDEYRAAHPGLDYAIGAVSANFGDRPKEPEYVTIEALCFPIGIRMTPPQRSG
jgi:hypothetical protein